MNEQLPCNPYLPFWETVPDAEPHVFGNRLYVFGSHDRLGGTTFCSDDYVVWSAPVSDPGHFRFDGVSYRASQDPLNGAPYDGPLPDSPLPMGTADHPHLLYAPDVCRGQDGRYYLYYALDFADVISVAVADRPEGPYHFLAYCLTPEGKSPEPGIRFDPAVLCEPTGTWLYYGFAPKVRFPGQTGEIPGAMVVRLDRDMHTVISTPVPVAFGCERAAGTSFAGHPFFEGPSIRRIGASYYFVYSSLQGNELCYATGPSPEGPFTFRGVLISNGDLGFHGRTVPDNFTGNNHGGLVQFGGKTFIFYHRHTHGTQFSRQGCAEEVEIEADGTIPQAEVTSFGLAGGRAPAKGRFSAHIYAQLLKPGRDTMGDALIAGPGEALPPLPADWPYLTEEPCEDPAQKNLRPYLANLQAGACAGFRYLVFVGTENTLQVTCRGKAQMCLHADAPEGEVLASWSVDSKDWTAASAALTPCTGAHAVYLKVEEGRADLAFFAIS